jgi:HlyD family secretion protein
MNRSLIFFLMIFLAACSANDEKSDAYGTFEATEITVSAEASGKILRFGIEEGQVLPGDSVIGLIDTIDLSLKREQISAQRDAIASKVKNILSQIEVQKQQKTNLLKEKDRIEKLLKDNAATTKQLDDINASISVIDRQIESIETQNSTVISEIRGYEKQIEQVSESIRKCYIRTSSKGTVLNKFAQAGEVAMPGKALFKIAGLDELWLRVYVSGDELPRLKLNQKVEVMVDADKDNNRKLEGTVGWISSTAEFTPKIIQTKEERVNLVYAVKIRVKNDGSLKIGMPGEMNILISNK